MNFTNHTWRLYIRLYNFQRGHKNIQQICEKVLSINEIKKKKMLICRQMLIKSQRDILAYLVGWPLIKEQNVGHLEGMLVHRKTIMHSRVYAYVQTH